MIEKIKKKFNLNRPYALGFDEWDSWHEKTKNERPFAYFIMETVPDKFDDVVGFFTKPVNDLRYAIRVRIFDRYHVIKTGLKPGYQDCDTRMMHGMFNMLIDFVEVEKAWMHVAFDKEEQKKRKHPWWSMGLTRFKAFRDPDSGIDYLKWEMKLDDPSLSQDEQSPSQAQAAREIWQIYHWWKYVRPVRPDPYDASGWSEWCHKIGYREMFRNRDRDPDEVAREKEILDRTHEIARAYDQEDEDMLIRLVKIRKNLWT
jgi:hypothetical protein